jgi:hypothetical protein
VLVKPPHEAPRSEWEFLGEFTVKKVARVDASEFEEKYRARAVEVREAPFPRSGEWSWVIQFSGLTRYERPVKLGECNDIVSQKGKPLSEWQIHGFTLISPGNIDTIINGIRNKAAGVLVATARFDVESPRERGYTSETPSHRRLVEMIRDIGEWLGFVVKVEEKTPDGLYILDVTWRDAPGHAPLKAFEVDVKGNVDLALARLTHAKDMWNCEQLYLVISDEAKASRVMNLVEPRLRGSFAKIKDRLTVLGYEDIVNLHSSLEKWKDLLAKLSKR